ncbi:serine hydrolase domain-containing protein [Nonomuraea sp. NPDC050556]|uniref:serine hydrolase domain-containing protein n=1 Tax=Nonomuraea sp. NPDC050556 TaxID=3364369 RepID=UPI0037B19A6D
MREVLERHVTSGEVPGLVALVSRHGETDVEVLGTHEAGGGRPMRRDSIFRIASITKQLAAAVAMTLVEECRLRLDDPVDDLLPELADRKVLRHPDADLDDTVPAERPISVRDLLTFRLGIGAVMTPSPLREAMAEARLSEGPSGTPWGPDEWMKRLGALPLAHQPGAGWRYHTGSDVLGVLMSRLTGQSLDDLMRERLFDPLGMRDTGFQVPADQLHRLPTAYSGDGVVDDARDSLWARPRPMQSAGGGLVSTADDLLAFCTMMLDKGRYGGARILSRPTVELMTTDLLTEEQKAGNEVFFGEGSGWGLGFNVVTRRTEIYDTPGRFGWTGGTGTTAYTDPAEGLIGILLTQRYMDSPMPPKVFQDFWTVAYQEIDG